MQLNDNPNEGSEKELMNESSEELNQTDPVEQEVAQEDFSGYSREEIVEKLAEIVALPEPEAYKQQVGQLRDLYRIQAKEELEKQKSDFESSSEEDEFEFHDQYAEKFDSLMKEYNQKRIDSKKKKEKQLNDNLKQKKEILESLRTLPENTTNISVGFEKLQSLQALWRSIGPVPAGMGDELYKSYQFYVTKFYEGVKLNNELKDLDRKKNLELKTELCEKVEKLADEPSVKKAMEQLSNLQEQWRQIGQTGKETNDAIWERFKAATDKVYEKKRKLQEDLGKKQEENLVKKQALVEKLKPIVEAEHDNHKDWQKAVEQVESVFEEWKKVGPVPASNNDEVWKAFRGLRNEFMEKKDKFYSVRKDEEKENLRQKIALCEQAEELKDSHDWKKATDKLKQLQAQWKEIGGVSRKDSDKVWKRFRAACDHFFNRKNQNYEEQKSKLSESLKEREDFISSIESAEPSEDQAQNAETLNSWKEKWEGMGELSREDKGKYSAMYKRALDVFMDKLKSKGGDPKAFERMKYNQLMQTEEGQEQVRRERSAISSKIKKIEEEIISLENNLSFFGRSKNAEAMLSEYRKKIDDGKVEIQKLKDQLKTLPRIQEPERTERLPDKNKRHRR